VHRLAFAGDKVVDSWVREGHLAFALGRDQYGWRRSGYQIEPCKFTDMVWIWLIPMDKTVTGRNRGFL
jgi:hypothetical protein